MRSLTTEPNIHDYDSNINKDSRLTSLQTVMFLFKLYTYNRFIALKNTSLEKDKNEYPHKYASRNSLRLLDRLHMMLYLNKKTKHEYSFWKYKTYTLGWNHRHWLETPRDENTTLFALLGKNSVEKRLSRVAERRPVFSLLNPFTRVWGMEYNL